MTKRAPIRGKKKKRNTRHGWGRVGWGAGRQIFSTEPIIHQCKSSFKRKGLELQILAKTVLGTEFYFEGEKPHLSLRLERTMNSPETLLPSVQ